MDESDDSVEFEPEASDMGLPRKAGIVGMHSPSQQFSRVWLVIAWGIEGMHLQGPFLGWEAAHRVAFSNKYESSEEPAHVAILGPFDMRELTALDAPPSVLSGGGLKAE
jgi:hypothetical protein